MDAVVKRWNDNTQLCHHNVGFLLWGVLDVVIDGYFDAVQSLDDEIESLEDLLFDTGRRSTEVQRRPSSCASRWLRSGGLCSRPGRCSTP